VTRATAAVAAAAVVTATAALAAAAVTATAAVAAAAVSHSYSSRGSCSSQSQLQQPWQPLQSETVAAVSHSSRSCCSELLLQQAATECTSLQVSVRASE